MARQETILSVFVASPSDLEEERNKLEEVIREHNITWARDLGVRLDLVRWETHAYPSFGVDPQAVINEQIPNDYDIFIGLMWYRFGTPTGRAGSGTVEEFELAKERFDKDNSSVNLMFYFKDAPIPIPPTKINHQQISKLIDFKDSLGEEGGLYWSFSSIEDFEKLVRLHLTRYIQAWKQNNSGELPSTIPTNNVLAETSQQDTIEEDIGLIDLMEKFEDEFETLVEIMERIALATTEVGLKMNERTEETNKFNQGPNAKNRKEVRRLIDKAAIDMDQYTHRMESEVPLFSEHLDNGMNSLIKASEISIDLSLNNEDISQVEDNLDGIKDFYETLITVEGQMTEFQQSVATLPRMTSKLNRSKSAMVKVLQKLIDSFHKGQAMAREAERSLESTIEQHNKTQKAHNKTLH